MLKKAALIASCVTAGAAAAQPELYGKLMLGVEAYEEGGADLVWRADSYASRFGVKGEAATDLGTTEVVYKLEWEVDVSDEKDSEDNHLKARNQYLGLQGPWGRLLVGRHDTPSKSIASKFDLFNDVVDIKRLMGGVENRADNMLLYTSPRVAGVEASVMTIMERTQDGALNDAYGVAANWRHARHTLAAAYDVDIDGEGTRTLRLLGRTQFGRLGLGLLWQSTDWNTGEDERALIANADYDIGRFRFKAQFGRGESYRGTPGRDPILYALGVDHRIGAASTLGLFLAREEDGDIGLDAARDTLGILVIHSF